MKITLCKSRISNQYYWRLVARNGQVLATSETYKQKPITLCKRLAKDFGIKFDDLT